MQNFSRCRDYNRKKRFYSLLRETQVDGLGSILTLWLLEILIDHADDNGQCYPSDTYLANELMTSRQSIIQARKILIKLGAFYNHKPDASTFHYQLTGVLLDFKANQAIAYIPLTPEEEGDTLLDLEAHGYPVKNFDSHPVKKFDTKKVIPSLEENNCLEFQKDESGEVLIDPDTKERVLISSSVECYEKSHPYLKWFEVTEGKLIDSRPYKAVDTYYSLPKNGTLIRARRKAQMWVLIDAHTFLAHMTTKKGNDEELVPYGNSSLYMPILSVWANANLSEKLLKLSVHELYRVWLEYTGGQKERLKYFPKKPTKILEALKPKVSE